MQVEALQLEVVTLQSRLAEAEEQAKQSRQQPEQQFFLPDHPASQEESLASSLAEDLSHARDGLQAAERQVQELSDQSQAAKERNDALSTACDSSEGGLTSAKTADRCVSVRFLNQLQIRVLKKVAVDQL